MDRFNKLRLTAMCHFVTYTGRPQLEERTQDMRQISVSSCNHMSVQDLLLDISRLQLQHHYGGISHPYRPSNICQPGTHLLGLGQSLRSAVGCAGRRRSGKWVSPLHPPYPASPLSLSPSNLPPRPPWVVPPLIVERDRPEVAPHTPVAYQSHANGAVHCCKLL